MNILEKDPAKLMPTTTESLKFSGFEMIKPFIIFNAIGLSSDDAEKHFIRFKEQ